MKFCPKCGSVLFPKKVKSSIIMYCKKCGYEEKSEDKMKIKEKVTVNKNIPIISKSSTDDLNAFPITVIECPKCGNDHAYFRIEQTRSGDEAPTRFYKCTKCGYVWREYD